MKGNLIALAGIAAAVLYGLFSHKISGSWNFALAVEIGVIVALAFSGFRMRSTEVKSEEKAKNEGEGEEVEKVVVDSCREEEHSGLADQSVDAEPSLHQEKENPSLVVRDEDIAFTKEPNYQSTPTPITYTFSTAPVAPPVAEPPEALWERARVMVHGVIPDPVEDAEYLNLVFSAAEGGYVPALAKLGDYAFRRGAFVEAYFWTKIAKRRLELEDGADPQGLKEIDDMLRNIRRAWTVARQPLEFENVYEGFPEERGELGRAFLRLDVGIEVKRTRDFIQALANKGNPDAALFAQRRI